VAKPPQFSSDFSETQASSEVAYKGGLLEVRRDEVRLHDGKTAWREYIVHPGAVMILAFVDDETILLERQFRYPVGREFFELPAGKIDPGEEPLATARRELAEETGHLASSWRRLAVIHPSIGYSTERIEIFLARGLTPCESRLDDEEFLEVFTLPLATAIDWVRTGAITDTKSVAALFWADKLAAGLWK